MRITILDGLNDQRVGRVAQAAATTLGHTTTTYHLADECFATCRGCWECWVAHPGTCRASDASNALMADWMASDEILWITAPRFGCWDPASKGAFDKMIGLLSPFFTTIAGETHHFKRYRGYPTLRVLAVGPRDIAFEALIARNALNFHAEQPAVQWLDCTDAHASIGAAVHNLLDGIARLRPVVPTFHHSATPMRWEREYKRAVVWVGSAKPDGTSTSESLARGLMAPLRSYGFEAEVVQLRKMVASDGVRPSLLGSLDGADLLVMACPVYIDSVPALTLRALHALADQETSRRPAFVPIVQCGFPELSHTALALRILERASREAGMRWAGHIALGGGGAIDGKPIEPHGMLRLLHKALQDAGHELGRTGAISEARTRAASAPLMPGGFYRAAGQIGWMVRALQNGALTHLWDRPLDSSQTRAVDA